MVSHFERDQGLTARSISENLDYSPFIDDLRSRVGCLTTAHPASERVVSVFLYGGNVESLIRGDILTSTEIDLLFVIREKLLPGKPPLPTGAFHGFCQGLQLMGRDVDLIFNGVPALGYDERHILLDVIGDGWPNIREADPASVVVAHKPRMPIYGSDVYKELENAPVTTEGRRALFNTLTKYVAREFLNRNDSFANRAVAKNALFLASLLDARAVSSSNKRQLVELVGKAHTELARYLDYFLGVIDLPDRVDMNALVIHYQEFCMFYKENYL